MADKFTQYDPAEDLKSDEAIAVFMAEAFETEDAGYIAHALGVVTRAKELPAHRSKDKGGR
jgi:probable addiction module antidote protein